MREEEAEHNGTTKLGVLTALGLALAGTFMVSSGAIAQQTGSLVTAVYQCPEGYNDEAYAADCTEPAVSIEFTLGTPNLDNTEKTTSRGDSLATFSLAPFDLDPSGSAQLILGESATQTGDFAVSCTDNGAALDLKYETADSLPSTKRLTRSAPSRSPPPATISAVTGIGSSDRCRVRVRNSRPMLAASQRRR